MDVELTRGEKFKDARLIHNQHGKQTMRDVQNATGVQTSLISSLEDDDSARNVGYMDIVKLANHYGVSLDYLLGQAKSPSPNETIQGVCHYTGLSQNSIQNIRKIAYSNHSHAVALDSFFDNFIDLHVLCETWVKYHLSAESVREVINKPYENEFNYLGFWYNFKFDYLSFFDYVLTFVQKNTDFQALQSNLLSYIFAFDPNKQQEDENGE